MQRIRLVIIILLFLPLLLSAQGLFDSASFGSDDESASSLKAVQFNGYARGSVIGGSEQYDLSNSFAEVAFQTSLKHKEALLNSDIRLRKGVAFKEDYQDIEIKELYTGYSSKSLDLLAGYQLVNWGRTDGFNPTNNINPTDAFFLTADPDDQKMSNLMLRMRYRFSPSIDIDIVGIPYFKPSVYRFDLFDLKQEFKIEDFVISIPNIDANVDFNPLVLPDKKLTNGSFGARLNFELPQIGFAVSYFSGYDPYHGLDLDTFNLNFTSLSNPISINIEYTPTVYKKQAIGFDFALPLSGFIVRGEAAYNIISSKHKGMYVPNNDFSYVLAIEKMWNDYVFIAQLIGKNVVDFEELEQPVLDTTWDITKLVAYADDMMNYQSCNFNRLIFGQYKEQNFAATFTVSKSFAYDVWNAELTGYYNMTTNEYFIRPKVTWKVNDYLTVNVGGNYMHAKHNTLFNYSSKVMNGVFAEIKVHF